MKLKTLSLLLPGFLLAGSLVVADDDCMTASGNRASAHNASVAAANPTTSATDTESATTSNCEHSTTASVTNGLPPLTAGVTELKFNEFFLNPVGPRGLELTEKLRSLDGKRVRIAGFMVRQSTPSERCFLLSPVPVILHEHEYGFADELPSSTIHVFTSPESPSEVPFTPGVLLLTGTLSVGNRAEADGRNSLVRLQLDPPTAEQQKAVEASLSAAAKKNEAHAGHVH